MCVDEEKEKMKPKEFRSGIEDGVRRGGGVLKCKRADVQGRKGRGRRRSGRVGKKKRMDVTGSRDKQMRWDIPKNS